MTDQHPQSAMEIAERILHQAQTTVADPITGDPTSALIMLRDDIACALTDYAREARRLEREKCAIWHNEQMDHAADKELHMLAQFHSDAADRLRALPDEEEPT